MYNQILNSETLSLFDSIVNESNDAIITKTLEGTITSWNKAAEKLFGYTAQEVIDRHIALIIPEHRLNEETDIINKISAGETLRHMETERLRKDGRTVHVSLTVSPLKDADGCIKGAAKIARDITRQKQEEAQGQLLTGINQLFNGTEPLNNTISKALSGLMQFGGFVMGEIWLLESEKAKIYMAASIYTQPAVYEAFGLDKPMVTGARGRGLPGTTWQQATTQFWDNIDQPGRFLRYVNAQKAGLQSAYGFPLLYQEKVLGVVIVAQTTNTRKEPAFEKMLENVCLQLGHQVQRKLLEKELNQVFTFTPDVLCIANTDGYFKKVNPAMCTLLGYTEDELTASPFLHFVHPADKTATATALHELTHGKPFYYIENRYITKNGEIKWLAWTTTEASNHGEFYCSAKDITEKKNLEYLLHTATNLARIGGWDIDLVKGSVYWSAITREIMEVGPDFDPGVVEGLQFYKEGESRQLVKLALEKALTTGETCDIEVEALTARGNTKWVRVISETEFVDGRCRRIIGSMQDIDNRKQAELAAQQALQERNNILESIGDGFFAVDNNWQITYWNSAAEKSMSTPRESVLHKNFWDVFSDYVDTLSHQQYLAAMQTGQAIHFEDYSAPLQRWYEISAYPSASGLSVFFKDITARKLDRAALEESEKKYHDLFHLSPLPMWVVNLDTLAFLDVNGATVNHYGYSREEFLGMTLADIRPAEELPRLARDVAESKATGRLEDNIVTHRKKNGDIITVAIELAPLYFKGIKADIVIATDVTERLRDTQAIQEQNKQLKKIAWLQSHVIRAPLARMMGLINLVKSVTSNAEKEEYLHYIASSAEELDDIIKQITIETKTLK